MYIHRTLEACFNQSSHQFPVLLVTGPRQIGKTTLLRYLSDKKRTYVTLDDPMICSLARTDPALFLQRFQPPVLIDEIQYAPELLPYIKMAVDSHSINGQFWLAGSQQFHLMNTVSESLAGRIGILNLLGFSRRERIGKSISAPFLPSASRFETYTDESKIQLLELFQAIWLGDFPALYKSNEGISINRDLFYSSYVQTYLQRDIRDLANVGDDHAFLRFLRTCAARTGQLINMQVFCQDAGVSQLTGKRWLSIIETSGLIFLLEPYHSNINKRLVKTPKLYFLDTGLAAYLTQWSTPETLEAGAMSGAFLETWVISEIIKSYWHNGKRAPIYFYRDKDKKEIDLLIEQDGKLHPVEIKKSATIDKRSISQFSVLKTLKQPIGNGCVISMMHTHLPINNMVYNLPVGEL